MGETIVNRLRAWVSEVNDSKLAIISDCQEAADEISRLTEENERLRSKMAFVLEGCNEARDIAKGRGESHASGHFDQIGDIARTALSKGEG